MSDSYLSYSPAHIHEALFSEHFNSSGVYQLTQEPNSFDGDASFLQSLDFIAIEDLDAEVLLPAYNTESGGGLKSANVADEQQESPSEQPALDFGGDSPTSSRCSDNSQSIIPEHYGPGCWLSVCSSLGCIWVQQRCGSGFESIATELTATWAKQLRLDRSEPTIRCPEPESHLAWKYVNAYFERSVDSIFEVVRRYEFEWHLRSHFDHYGPDNDPAWYALRNAVYASGCRLYHSSNHAAEFATIHNEAWGYFSNALSVHSELLLRSPSLKAVRALLAMALFAEGLGSPALGSGLIANAALLAQSLGLHRKAPTTELSTDSERVQRVWLFWAIYCCEKNISRRTGRPSVIDDDDIGCEIPTEAHRRSTFDQNVMRCLIQSCQISSRICKRLMSARSLKEQPAQLLEIVMQLGGELQAWKDCLPISMRPKDCSQQAQETPNEKSLTDILISCSYYDLLMVLHAPFAYPWVTDRFCCGPKVENRMQLNAQIARSAEAMVGAARSIIMMARNFEINGANTHAFMLHYPMHAFVNLFIYILTSPVKPSVQKDLALLDVATGYFGQMDFVTGSKLSFPFARDIATFGRRAVDRHKT